MKNISCGELFCENCGDCYSCYGGEECYRVGSDGEHSFDFTDFLEEDDSAPDNT